MTGEFEIAVGL